jgi:hypothetical protein
MQKTPINTLIKNMQSAGIVTKATPWVNEGIGEKAMEVRYVGIRVGSDWEEIMSQSNNLLLKFVRDSKIAYLEFYLANTPPFLKLNTIRLNETDKWEWFLGELKRKLKKDKDAYIHHEQTVGNLYEKMKPFLK